MINKASFYVIKLFKSQSKYIHWVGRITLQLKEIALFTHFLKLMSHNCAIFICVGIYEL